MAVEWRITPTDAMNPEPTLIGRSTVLLEGGPQRREFGICRSPFHVSPSGRNVAIFERLFELAGCEVAGRLSAGVAELSVELQLLPGA